jgi:hypothetical protein
VNSEFPLTSIDTLVSQSALILRGRIENAIAHLTEDESLVLTAYTIRPIELIKQPPEFGSLSAPGVVPTIKVEIVGGDLSVDGLRLRTQSDIYNKTTQLTVGAEYVFFLTVAPSRRPPQTLSVFVPTAGVFGILPIREGKLTNLSPSVSARRALPTEDPSTFVKSVRATASKANH